MIRVYTLKYDAVLTSCLIEGLDYDRVGLPVYLREDRCKSNDLSFLGKLLTLNVLKEQGIGIKMTDIIYSEYGKPSLTGHEIIFNVSHSGNYIVCGICEKGALGIDIEEIKDIDINAFKKCFLHEEWQQIKSSRNSVSLFYQYWTTKEAVVKADGRGLSMPLGKVSLSDGYATVDNTRYNLAQIPLNHNYTLSAAFLTAECAPVIREDWAPEKLLTYCYNGSNI